MKTIALLATVGLVWVAGCTTRSTVESRRAERHEAYQGLSAEQKAAVDAGRLKVGMSKDAVYIALGKPQQILTGETSRGAMETWLYLGHVFREMRYWSYHHYYAGPYLHASPYLAADYYPQYYIKTQVFFDGPVVKEWHSLPEPVR